MAWVNNPWGKYDAESPASKKKPWVLVWAAFFIVFPLFNFLIGIYSDFQFAEQLRDPKDRPVTQQEFMILRKEVNSMRTDKDSEKKLDDLSHKLDQSYVSKKKE